MAQDLLVGMDEMTDMESVELESLDDLSSDLDRWDDDSYAATRDFIYSIYR